MIAITDVRKYLDGPLVHMPVLTAHVDPLPTGDLVHSISFRNVWFPPNFESLAGAGDLD